MFLKLFSQFPVKRLCSKKAGIEKFSLFIKLLPLPQEGIPPKTLWAGIQNQEERKQVKICCYSANQLLAIQINDIAFI